MEDGCFRSRLTARRAPWTAPELMRNLIPNHAYQGPVPPYVYSTTQTDVFAFAMTLIEVRTAPHVLYMTASYSVTHTSPQIFTNGKKPFSETKDIFDTKAMSLIMKGARPDLPVVVLRSRELQEIITKCWATDPHRRMSMREVCVRLAVVRKILLSPSPVF